MEFNNFFYIGIDDTDNAETRGTGFRARQLAAILIEKKLADVFSVSRHQLFFDPRVPFTSHNSSLCIELKANDLEALKEVSKKFLLEVAAEGSDVGLCIARKENISNAVIEFGKKAKIDLVTQKEAYILAEKNQLYLEGLTGTKDGIIGALASIGLSFFGNDGRCVWLKGTELREIKGVMSIRELLQQSNIDEVTDENGFTVPQTDLLMLDEWLRPILKNHKKILIIEEVKNEKYKWKLKPKDFIKKLSS